MADVEINLYVNEENELLEKERPIWPFVPSLCPVPTCRAFGTFSSFRDFRDHWTKKHTPEKSYYKCMSCGKLFSNNNHAKSHTKSSIHTKQTVTIKNLKVTNDEYINPGDYIPCQLGDKEDRQNMKTVQRELAREKRQRKTEERKDDYSIIPYYGDSVCRDERAGERNGRLYKDTNLWDTPGKRRRIPLLEPNSDI